LYDCESGLEDNIERSEQQVEAIKGVVDANSKKYGVPEHSFELSGNNQTNTPFLQNKKSSEFLNSIEKSLFGEFSSKQVKDFPPVRLKMSDWLELICF